MHRRLLKPRTKAWAAVALVTVTLLVTIPVVAQSANPSQSSSQTPASATPESSANPSTAPSGGGASSSTMMINTGDLLEVSVFGVPELYQKTRVDGNGQIYLPLLGYVKVGGQTAGDAQSQIEKALVDGGFVKAPHVSVFVAESTLGITIFGEVAHPGMQNANTVRTVLDLFSAAGGFTPAAGNVLTIATRNTAEPIKITWTNEKEKSIALNTPVRQGDTVTVSKAAVVYVVGEVVAPAGLIYDYSRRLTVLQVIAMAHGTTKDASLNGARLVRRTPTGVTDVLVPLKKIMQSKAPDIELEPEDILFVPTSAGKQATRRTIDTIMSVAGAAAIRSVY
jgi:polysaccharide biosynthesis/export protein